MSTHSLYAWLREQGVSRQARSTQKTGDLVHENARLRAELCRVEEDRDIVLCQGAKASVCRCLIY